MFTKSKSGNITWDIVKMLKSTKNVLLVTENSSFYCRSLITGITKFAKSSNGWSFFRDFDNIAYGPATNLQNNFFTSLDSLSIDGVITRNPTKTKSLTQRGVPTIIAKTELNISQEIPKLEIDHNSVGRMAAEYFLEKGYKEFAYCGYKKMAFSEQRRKAYQEKIEEAGYKLNVYSSTQKSSKQNVQLEILYLAEWLKTLKKPSAIFVCSDARALNVVDAAKIANIHIPGHIAVLGVDNDDFLCNTCDVPLSSILLNAESGGFEAGQLLNNLMNGEKMSGQQILIRPIQVITRVSTEISAIADDDVIKAIKFINDKKNFPIQINDIVDYTAVSRRYLQEKFRKILNTTIFDEIQNTRIKYAKDLLLNTSMNISEISNHMHFAGINCFSRYFKKYTDTTPLEFRRQFNK